MAEQTGGYGLGTLLAERFASIIDFGTDNIIPIIEAELAAHNRMTLEMISAFAAPLSTLVEGPGVKELMWGSAVGGEMSEIGEYGQAPTKETLPGSKVGFPLRRHQFNLGWTDDWFRQHTPADMAIAVQNGEIAHLRRIRRQLKRALTGSANSTFRDYLVKTSDSIGVKGLLNADGSPIPAGPNGEVFDPLTETHYTAEAALSNSGAQAHVENVIEKGHGNQVETYITRADEAAWRALTDFKEFVNVIQLLSADARDPRQQARPDTNYLDRAIGEFHGSIVWVKPWAIPNYAITCDVGEVAEKKPLAFREQTGTDIQGLRLMAEIAILPLHAKIMQADFGFGVNCRTCAAVHQFNNGTYQSPTIND